jgi:hypothetical protein
MEITSAEWFVGPPKDKRKQIRVHTTGGNHRLFKFTGRRAYSNPEGERGSVNRNPDKFTDDLIRALRRFLEKHPDHPIRLVDFLDLFYVKVEITYEKYILKDTDAEQAPLPEV